MTLMVQSDAFKPWMATPKIFMDFWFWTLEPEEEAELIPFLLRVSGRIISAMQASGQDNCQIAPHNMYLLQELHCVAAGVFFNSSTFRLSDNQRTIANEYVTEQLMLIRTGELALCTGETGKNTPAFGVAEINVNQFSYESIIKNELLRGTIGTTY